jgi:hypothetical protein
LPSGQRARLPWSEEEEEALVLGVAAFGVGAWTQIKKNVWAPGQHSALINRTGVDLKDKWRSLGKQHGTDLALRVKEKKRTKSVTIKALEQVARIKKPRQQLKFDGELLE